MYIQPAKIKPNRPAHYEPSYTLEKPLVYEPCELDCGVLVSLREVLQDYVSDPTNKRIKRARDLLRWIQDSLLQL